jgi:hypothetical protein
MGCGGRQNALPPNGTVVQIAKERKPRQDKPRSEVPRMEKRAKTLIDHHCEQCGYVGPHAQHVCKPKPITWMETRQATCRRCPYAVDGVCSLYKSQHPDRDAVISVGIEMPYAACPAGLWPQVEFTCDECGSVSFDPKGISQCKSCKKKVPRKVSLANVVSLKLEMPFAATQELVVVTLGVGYGSQSLLDLTAPQMKAYADRCNADFHIITDDLHPRYSLANKFRLHHLTQSYARTLFVDADVWIRSTAPDIFAANEPGAVWIHPDTSRHAPNVGSARHEMEMLCKEHRVEPFAARMLNSGVVLFDRDQADIWKPPIRPLGTRHISEQMWVEHNIVRSSHQQRDLDSRFNWQWYFPEFSAKEHEAYFIHLAACPHEERIYRLRKLAHAESMIPK